MNERALRPVGILDPAPATLAKYGMALDFWLRMAKDQDWRCAVCRKNPKRLVIDHEHVPGYKHMPPALRLRHVRGLTCDSCNHYVLTRYADANKHRQAAEYLERYERRRDATRH